MELPPIGLGTWDIRGDLCERVINLGIELGYRHIDTAHVYENHQAIGKAISGLDRSKIFITSKIWIEDQVDPQKPKESVKKACELALKELNTEYLDLYLIHWPREGMPIQKIYESMLEMVANKKVLHVGVSNFTIHHLEDLRQTGYIPYANQVEFHPHLNQKDLLLYCKSHGIQLIGYRPFGKGNLFKENPIFNEIGKSHGKTGAQVILRWLFQKNIASIPKASSQTHLKENIEIFDFNLSNEEIQLLDSIDQFKRYCKPNDPAHSY